VRKKRLKKIRRKKKERSFFFFSRKKGGEEDFKDPAKGCLGQKREKEQSWARRARGKMDSITGGEGKKRTLSFERGREGSRNGVSTTKKAESISKRRGGKESFEDSRKGGFKGDSSCEGGGGEKKKKGNPVYFQGGGEKREATS